MLLMLLMLLLLNVVAAAVLRKHQNGASWLVDWHRLVVLVDWSWLIPKRNRNRPMSQQRAAKIEETVVVVVVVVECCCRRSSPKNDTKIGASNWPIAIDWTDPWAEMDDRETDVVVVVVVVASYPEALYGASVQPERGAGASGGAALSGAGGRAAGRGGLDAQRRADRAQEGAQLHHQQRGPPAHRPGPAGRHGQLHLPRRQRRRTPPLRHGPPHRRRSVAPPSFIFICLFVRPLLDVVGRSHFLFVFFFFFFSFFFLAIFCLARSFPLLWSFFGLKRLLRNKKCWSTLHRRSDLLVFITFFRSFFFGDWCLFFCLLFFAISFFFLLPFLERMASLFPLFSISKTFAAKEIYRHPFIAKKRTFLSMFFFFQFSIDSIYSFVSSLFK